jgi:NAD(P)-dependent dehydrogenase (short-subunit alcohol dehydrogenase family)
MSTLTADSPTIHTDLPSLDGKNVIVSGGTSGNGRAIATLLAAYGANVLIYGRRENELHEAISELEQARGRAYGLVADQSKADDIRRVFEEADRRLGSVDLLINNASLAADELTSGSDDDWRYRLHTDLFGYIDCTRRAVERMKAKGSGHIVNIGSVAAVHEPKGESLYVAAKSAIHGFTQTLRKELAEYKIKVSLIEPGYVATQFLGGDHADPQKQRRDLAAGAMLKPEDIAVAVYYCITQPARCSISLLQIEPLRVE